MFITLLSTMFTAQAESISPPIRAVGLEVQRLTPRMRRYLDAPSGLLITDVRAHSSAYGAGLEAGDVLLSLDGEHILYPAELSVVLSAERGEEVEFCVYRDHDILCDEVVLPGEPWRLTLESEEIIAEQEEEIARLRMEVALLEAGIDLEDDEDDD